LISIIEAMPSWKRRKELKKHLRVMKRLNKESIIYQDLINQKKLKKRIKIVKKELNELKEFRRSWDGEEFIKTITFKNNGEEVSFKIVATGESKENADQNRWLQCLNMNTGSPHYIKMANGGEGYTLDYEWMSNANIYSVREEEEAMRDCWLSDMKPCQDDDEICGVTCFNCPLGN
jgi:hypothetical protein